MIKTKLCKCYLTCIAWIAENVLLFLRRKDGKKETEELIYMSVGGLLRLSRSFILTAIRTIFIYDFLIISAFLNNKIKIM